MSKNIEFPISLDISIAWGDMDAYGHINNTVYFKYFESVRMKYFEQIDMLDLMERESVGPILAATSCIFKRPLVYPSDITVKAGIQSIGNTSMVMAYQIQLQDGTLVAEGDSVVVMHNYITHKNESVPKNIIERIEVLENKSFQ